MTGNRGYLGKATLSLVESSVLDQAAEEDQQAMPQLRGITESSSHIDTAPRSVDRLGVLPLIGEQIRQNAKSAPAFGKGQRRAFFVRLGQEPATIGR